MSDLSLAVAPQTQRHVWVWRIVLFFVLLIAGELYVKWYPYFNKMFIAAAKHSLGASIITGHQSVAPAPSLLAAWDYAKQYFLAVWEAVILGVIVGAAVQTLLPKQWILRLFSKSNTTSLITASALSLPGMMCTCCTAPVVVGLRKQQASVGAALAYWMGNPVLNPATIIFMGFVLGWKFVVIRVIFGLLLILGVGTVTNHLYRGEAAQETMQQVLVASTQKPPGSLVKRFFTQLGKIALTIVPAYVVLVLAVGALRAWLFPMVVPGNSFSLLWVVGLAIAGTLFVIPTAGEVPIIQSMMKFGLGTGPAFALLMTLPAVSAPSIAMVWRQFPRKALLIAASFTVLSGIVAGLIGMVI